MLPPVPVSLQCLLALLQITSFPGQRLAAFCAALPSLLAAVDALAPPELAVYVSLGLPLPALANPRRLAARLASGVAALRHRPATPTALLAAFVSLPSDELNAKAVAFLHSAVTTHDVADPDEQRALSRAFRDYVARHSTAACVRFFSRVFRDVSLRPFWTYALSLLRTQLRETFGGGDAAWCAAPDCLALATGGLLCRLLKRRDYAAPGAEALLTHCDELAEVVTFARFVATQRAVPVDADECRAALQALYDHALRSRQELLAAPRSAKEQKRVRALLETMEVATPDGGTLRVGGADVDVVQQNVGKLEFLLFALEGALAVFRN